MDPRLDLIYKRRSIRAFQDRPVEKENLTELLKAEWPLPAQAMANRGNSL
jgi:hypothetical protein